MKEIKVPKKNDFKYIKESISNILVNLGYQLTNYGTDNDSYIVFSKGMSILSYGERITINIVTELNHYYITIQSESKGIQLLDWGNNNDNEEEIALELTNNLK